MAEQMMQETADKAIPVGYKQTEVGIIPEDWMVQPLSSLSVRITDGEHLTPERTDSGYYLLSARNIHNGYLDLSDIDYVGESEYLRIRRRCNPEEGDALISCSGSIGRVCVIPQNFECVMVRSVALIKSSAKKLSGHYVQYFLQSSAGQSQILSSLNQGAQANLFLNHIQDIRLALPRVFAEQTMIANVLSDSDALIDALEQLIAKKQAIKSATMQQLLTGRTRLPAFALHPDGTPKGYKPSELGDIPEDWEVVSLGDICGLYQPVTISGSQLKESGYPVYGANGLIGFYEKYNHEASQVIVTCRGSTCGTVNYTVAKSWITGNAMVVDVDKNKNLDKNFTYYMLSHQDLTVCITGSGQPQIVRSPLAAFKVVLPEIEEQTAIATILSDMDNELQTLTQKLEKARALKQGMMQQLLTGKIRLPLAAGA